jgi:hypothetical protein
VEAATNPLWLEEPSRPQQGGLPRERGPARSQWKQGCSCGHDQPALDAIDGPSPKVCPRQDLARVV